MWVWVWLIGVVTFWEKCFYKKSHISALAQALIVVKDLYCSGMALHNYSRTFKTLRVALIQELPDPKVLLDNPAFRDQLSDSSRSQILSPINPCDRAEKLVDVMEFSSQGMFQGFLAALRPLKPELAARVERTQRQGEEEGGGRGASASGPSNRELLWSPSICPISKLALFIYDVCPKGV